MAASAGDRRKGVWLAVILFTSIALGAAAALLGATSSSGPPAGGFALPFHVALTFQELGWGILLAVLAWIVVHLLRRSSGTYPFGSRTLSFLATTFLVAIVFVLLFHAIAPGGPAVGSHSGQGNNSTGPPIPYNNTSAPLAFQPVNFSGFQVPGWVLLIAFSCAAGALALVAVGIFAGTRRKPPEARTPPVVPGREELDAALRALDGEPGADARSVILRLYGRLLRWVEPRVAGLETMTAREVERACVDRFGLRAETARDLTGIFEEARYSTHPLAPETVERTREVLNQALRELVPPTGVP